MTEHTDEFRKYINLITESQVAEALPVGLGQTLKNIAGQAKFWDPQARHTAKAKTDLDLTTNQYYLWLTRLMAQQGLSWDTLTYQHLYAFLRKKEGKFGLGLKKRQLNQVAQDVSAKFPNFPKTSQEFNTPTIISPTDTKLVQKIVGAAIQAGLHAYNAKATGLGSLGPKKQKQATATPTATGRSNRPYRMGGKSYTQINGRWLEVDPQGNTTPTPHYLVGKLNVLKKKIDAQRATGNLTDWKLPRYKKV